MKAETRLIEKQKELIEMISPHGAEFWGDETDVYTKLIKDISALEKELEQESSESVTAEEIYEQYIGGGQYGVDFEKKHILEAMKAYASSKQLTLREELEKFRKYLSNEGCTVLRNEVNEYLKQR